MMNDIIILCFPCFFTDSMHICFFPISIIINSWNNDTFTLPNFWPPSRFQSFLEKQPSNIRQDPILDHSSLRKRNRQFKFIKRIISFTNINHSSCRKGTPWLKVIYAGRRPFYNKDGFFSGAQIKD